MLDCSTDGSIKAMFEETVELELNMLTAAGNSQEVVLDTSQGYRVVFQADLMTEADYESSVARPKSGVTARHASEVISEGIRDPHQPEQRTVSAIVYAAGGAAGGPVSKPLRVEKI